MNNNKKYFAFGVLAIILIAAVILGISNARKNKKSLVDNSVKMAGAQIQSYEIKKNPELTADDKTSGAKNAKLNIFVYEDYANIYSANLADTLEKIKSESAVSIIVRPYVSADILSKNAALAMACSNDKWVEMRALLFAQVKNKQLSLDNFSANAKQIGLDENEFNNCLTNPEKSRTIEKSQEDMKAYSVTGAPTMFVGDELVIGARPYDDYVDSNGDKIEGLKNLVDRKLGK